VCVPVGVCIIDIHIHVPRKRAPVARMPVQRAVLLAIVHGAALDLVEELHRPVPDGAERADRSRENFASATPVQTAF
jgi:hypothetical protein